MAHHDVVIVGSGINSLVCAAILGQKGAKVCVVERNSRIGGTIRTEELTEPGFKHDAMSCWYPLFIAGPAYAALKDDLAAHGLEFCFTQTPSGVIRPDQSNLVLHADRDATVAALDAACAGDGARYRADMSALEPDLDLMFALLGGQLWSLKMAARLGRETWHRKPAGMAAFVGDTMRTARDWLSRTYQGELTHALFVPWVLHTGLGPESAMSGAMGRLIAFTLEQIGMPVVKGGSSRITDAFASLITAQGGTILTGLHVERIVLDRSGTARAVRTSTGEEIPARRAIVCNVPPPALYGKLLPEGSVAPSKLKRARDYRFGRANMQIHLALSRPAQWTDAALDAVAAIHITPGLDGVARAVTQAESGLLPTASTIVAGQPAVVDPSRVPEGAGQLWIQLQELPRRITGDAAGEIDAPSDGLWNDAVSQRFADRIVKRLAHHIPDLDNIIIGRKVLGPHDLENMNCNLVGGDPYCGDCAIDQFALWRPFPGAKGHRTGVDRLWHIGASTHPGPGLGGGSGFIVAEAI